MVHGGFRAGVAEASGEDTLEMTTLGLAASSLRAQQTRLDFIGHNLANQETPGFRALRPELVDLPADPSAFGVVRPLAVTTVDSPSRGVAVAGTTQPDLPGPLIDTGSPLDVALPDGVYLAVHLPDGKTAYTRDGHIDVDAHGTFEVNGNPLQGNLHLQPGDSSPAIDDRGRIVVVNSQGQRVLGNLPVARVRNPEGMQPLGLGLLSATTDSGPPQAVTVGVFDGLRPGMLEGSNVRVGQELTDLIRAQRAYQAGAQMVRTWDELVGQTVREVGNSS